MNIELAINRSTVGFAGSGRVRFSDINNRPLLFPNLVFPYRSACLRHARSAYNLALSSSSPHVVATNSAPSEEQWDALIDYCKQGTPEHSLCAYFQAFEDS